MENKKSKFYELEFINEMIKKIKYKGRHGAIYNFKYDNIKKVKDLVDFSCGIYFITKNDESADVYIGQTTVGVKRFFDHSMREFQDIAEIYFYSFEEEKPNKSLLDKIESEMIILANESKYNTLNKTDGNSSNLNGIDTQEANENIPIIIDLLKVFGIDLSFKDDSNLSEEFYASGDGFDFKIIRKNDLWILTKGSKVNALSKWNEYNGNIPYTNSFYSNFIHLVDKNNNSLLKDISWKSITPMVAFAKGNMSDNGWFGIKNKYGETPHSIYRKNVNN